jgi:DNA polymerase-3 subunit epsilon
MHYAVIDVETTGLYPGGRDRIVEIAIVALSSDLTHAGEFNSLLNPGRDLGPTWLHGIEARDVLDAPEFLDLAGAVSDRLAGAVIVGHNVSFDLRFIQSEFARGGIEIPYPPWIDTMSVALRMGCPSRCLQEACILFGVDVPESHTALGDARATAALFMRCIEHFGSDLIDECVTRSGQPRGESWPTLETRREAWPRQRAVERSRSEESFIAKLLPLLPASDSDPHDRQAYYALLDRALEDRRITSEEAGALAQEALEAGLTASDIKSANESYLKALINVALKDQVLSEIERRDIREVAQLLGLEEDLPRLLEVPTSSHGPRSATSPISDAPIHGHSVCFTGALNASIAGERATRELATAIATEHGMSVVKGVTKKLDYLVVADPDSLSGKAKKAREYGIRILAESVFWNLMGVDTDG